MTLKELAHAAHQALQARAGCDLRRSHVHELLAAAFGYQSWAAFHSDSLLADAGVGAPPAGGVPRVAGRALHLQYTQGAASAMAVALLELASERKLGAIRWAELADLLRPAPRYIDDDGHEDDDPDDADEREAEPGSVPAREQLLKSALLLSSLERAAASNPTGHQLLAALYRCARPNPYLYEESLKGRALTSIERGWADEYLRLEPQYRKYELHLKAAALGGVRAAALEYGIVFENAEFLALAEQFRGDVDALRMAEMAATPESRTRWLRTAAEQGSRSALQQLADQGDPWAEERVAAWGDVDWLRSAAGRALDRGDALRAWTWQYLALAHGADLTASTMAAYHDGGQQDGQFYDSDFGGPMYVDGDEGVVLPVLGPAGHRDAEAKARELFDSKR
jgi:hypothetical protein